MKKIARPAILAAWLPAAALLPLHCLMLLAEAKAMYKELQGKLPRVKAARPSKVHAIGWRGHPRRLTALLENEGTFRE